MGTGETHRFLPMPDGTRIFLRELGAADAARTLVVVHGYGEHGGRYVERMTAFANAGYRVLIPDVRGHGRSEGRRGAIVSWDQYLADLDAVWAEVRTPPERAGIFGHSNGGLIVASWLTSRHPRLAAAALTSPLLGLSIVPPRWKEFAARILGKRLPWVSLPSEIDPAVVSHDAAVVEAYRNDPFNHHVNNGRWYLEMLAAIDKTMAGAAALKTPLLVMQAGDDRLVSPAAAEKFARAVTGCTFELVPGAYHELLFEVEGARHGERVLRWFNERLA
jgi:alpha-beta hydrolase superfamily lysophospholipase